MGEFMGKLFYYTPASEWIDGLPIGNGRLAGMIWGEAQDYMTLNHEWLWTGRNRKRKTQPVSSALPLIRHTIQKGDPFTATALANAVLGGKGGISGLPGGVDDYQPAGELCIKVLGHPRFVSRELDLSTGVVKTQRTLGCAQITSAFFADCISQCLFSKVSSEAPFSLEISLNREAEEGTTVSTVYQDGLLRLDGAVSGGIQFAVQIKLFTDGQAVPQKDNMIINGATSVCFVVNAATSHENLELELSNYDPDPAQYEEREKIHCHAFENLMGRVDFALNEAAELAGLPTNERISRIKSGKTDNGIAKLYFDYGRYLLLSSTICGQLPANLQGKWNSSLTPAWNCDYHFDINIEMNYWMAEPAGMTECVQPLVRFVKSFLQSGKEAAKNLYGCRGIWLPIQTDAWGISTPESYGWDVWIGAAAWIARHLWDHYRYSGDIRYLKEEAYGFFTAVAEFYEDYLQQDQNGVFQIIPSQSPENHIDAIGCFPVLIDQSSAMDVQLCYDALSYAIRSAEILNVDQDKAEKWKAIQKGLPPFQIGTDGRLMEWYREYPEKEPGHRHLSHLYGLYPSDLFTPQTRPEQYKAAIRSLKHRLSYGGGHTGWSRAWVACLFARLGDPDNFYEHFTALIKDFATVSLLNLHPPYIFQIDGNLGGVSAVIESIVSYYDQTAHLLQALPKEWNSGHLNGIHIPGGHIVSISWSNRMLSHLSVTLGFERSVQFEYQGRIFSAQGESGQTIVLKQ